MLAASGVGTSFFFFPLSRTTKRPRPLSVAFFLFFLFFFSIVDVAMRWKTREMLYLRCYLILTAETK